MTLYNICSKRTFKTKEGEEKNKWLNVGILKKIDDGKMFLELNIFPNTPFYVFEVKLKEESSEFGD